MEGMGTGLDAMMAWANESETCIRCAWLVGAKGDSFVAASQSKPPERAALGGGTMGTQARARAASSIGQSIGRGWRKGMGPRRASGHTPPLAPE